MTQAPAQTIEIAEPAKEKGRSRYLCWLGAGAFVLLLALWFALDHGWPSWDAAEHTRIAGLYVPLLKHPRPWDSQWWLQLCSVNYFYPPTVYLTHGLLKTFFGTAGWVNDLRQILFASVLCGSIYYCGSTLFNTRVSGVLSVMVINCYPLVSYMSHSLMLDFPLLSMVSLSLASFIWWWKKPDAVRSMLLSVVIAAAVLTKHIGAAYIAGPGIGLLILLLWQRRWKQAVHLSLAGTVAIAIAAGWFFINRENMMSLAKEMQHDIGYDQAFVTFSGLAHYAANLPRVMSWPLLGMFVVAMAFANKAIWRKTALLWLSAGIGVIAVSSITYEPPDLRYILPALLLPAVVTGGQLRRVFSATRPAARAAGWAGVACCLAIYVLYNLTPYPVPINFNRDLLSGDSSIVKGAATFAPTRPGDLWRQEWIVRTIAKHQGNAPCWLNVLPSTPELSVHTLEAVVADYGIPLSISSFRTWSAAGDSFTYTDEQLGYFDWFLLKSGNQGYKLLNSDSKRKYDETLDYIRSHLKLIDKTNLPDGSELSLYRK